MRSLDRFGRVSILAAMLAVTAAHGQQEPIPVERTAPGNLDAVVDTALAHAAATTGLSVDELEVVSAEAVVWPDGSLGCPRPDVVYMQAPVPGYRVQVRAQQHLLNYHADSKGYVIVCPGTLGTDPETGRVR